MWFLLVLAVAIIGAIVGIKLKLPAAAMLGSMIAVAIFTVFTNIQATPKWIKVAAQMVSGGYIGTTMSKESLRQMKKVAPVAAALLFGMLLLNLATGTVLYLTSPLDLCTSLFATTPGGLTDVTIISDDMGANSPVVGVFQVCRMSSAIFLFPIIIPLITGVKRSGTAEKKDKKRPAAKMTREQYIAFAKTAAVAFCSGLLGYFIGIPAGTLTFSVIGVTISKIGFGIGYIPMRVKQAAQTLSGAFIGSKITMATVTLIGSMWYNVLFVLAVFIPGCLLLGFTLHKIFKLDIVTCLFCSAPAGASDMALIASDVGADGPNVAVLQIIRLLGVIAFFPPIIKGIVAVLGWNP